MVKSYKDLIIWQKGIDLGGEIYKVTAFFPKSELFALTSQIQRSAVSVPSNIAEGSARFGSKEFVQFLRIALGSCAELETQVTIAYNLKYLSKEVYNSISQRIFELQKMIYSMINKILAKNN